MTDTLEFVCTVVTPEKVVLERDVRFVAVPAHDGEIGFLKGRAPLVIKLDVGRLRVETDEGTEELFIDGGFAEMVHDRLTILTEDARRPEELDREQVLASRAEASARASVSEEAFADRQRALKRARTQLRMIDTT
jgi:F-type H+-transporting ATPase subunit epsilon